MFSIKDLFSKCDQICSFFTEEIINEKLHFLCSANYFRILLDFFGVTFRHIEAETATGRCS